MGTRGQRTHHSRPPQFLIHLKVQHSGLDLLGFAHVPVVLSQVAAGAAGEDEGEEGHLLQAGIQEQIGIVYRNSAGDGRAAFATDID